MLLPATVLLDHPASPFLTAGMVVLAVALTVALWLIARRLKPERDDADDPPA